MSDLSPAFRVESDNTGTLYVKINNTASYAFYQILFPSVRPKIHGYMQIAEMELLGEL